MDKMKLLLLLLAAMAVGTAACTEDEPKPAPMPFSDDFEREELGPRWSDTSGWRIRDGQVFSAGTHNQALWLKVPLPADALIELDARSESPAGDIKFELYGDGENHASGYILIFGGWNNTISTIARLDEHGSDRQELRRRGLVEPGRSYHFRVERRGGALRWFVDGKLLLDFYDPEPLRGEGHDRFAFNNWESQLYFDNLRIRPLADEAAGQPAASRP
jgi:hypothetical protein